MECKLLRNIMKHSLSELEGEERSEIATHLARNCPVCTPAVEKARWVVSQLAYLAPPASTDST